MNKRDIGAPTASSAIGLDLAQLAELPAAYTPQFLAGLTREPESMDRACSMDPVPHQSAHGDYRSIRETLGAPEQIDRAIEQLRSDLHDPKSFKAKDGRRGLVDAWIAVEPLLTEIERRDLYGKFIARLFPKSKITVSPTRPGYSRVQGE